MKATFSVFLEKEFPAGTSPGFRIPMAVLSCLFGWFVMGQMATVPTAVHSLEALSVNCHFSLT